MHKIAHDFDSTSLSNSIICDNQMIKDSFIAACLQNNFTAMERIMIQNNLSLDNITIFELIAYKALDYGHYIMANYLIQQGMSADFRPQKSAASIG